MSPYAALNPFAITSVGENDLWNAGAFPDVPGIHSGPFGMLKTAVEQVRAQRRSLVRFVRGAGGSGKSHVFSRLHRECADSIFYAYAANPPLQAEALESFILSRLVSSLRHPARNEAGETSPYSQLRLLAYALLKPVIEQPFTFPELHAEWAKIGMETRKELIHEAVQLLENDHPMVPRSVLRCLLNVLREDKEHLAAQWLAGAAYLTENELKYLGVQDALPRSEMSLVIQLFGRLAAQAGAPMVLVLDQLDLIVTQQQFDEMQRLLFSLIDQSENWVVLIGLVAERYVMWDSALTQALRGRIGVPDANAPLGFRLPVVDMLPIANEQKRLLLACRLEAPALVAQRQKDGITSVIHPFLEEDMARLTSGGATFPRHLLAAAAETYAMRTQGESQKTAVKRLPTDVVRVATHAPAPAPASTPLPAPAPVIIEVPVPVSIEAAAVVETMAETPPAMVPEAVARTPLADKIDALLQQALAAATSDKSSPNAIDLAERTRDLIELMAVPPVSMTEGDIRKTYDNFDGSDRWFAWGGSQVRIVTSDAMRGSFLAVLERVKAAKGDTVLLRHASAPVAGQLTLELLNVFKARNIFHHLSATEAMVLHALGRVLAAQREGSYDDLSTEPAATRDNVLAALRSHPMLRGTRLWESIQKGHVPKQEAAPQPQPSVLASIVRPPVAASPVAKPPPPPTVMPVAGAAFPQKPVARPPAPPAAKAPVAKPPAAATPRPTPKLPPPSKGNAA